MKKNNLKIKDFFVYIRQLDKDIIEKQQIVVKLSEMNWLNSTLEDFDEFDNWNDKYAYLIKTSYNIFQRHPLINGNKRLVAWLNMKVLFCFNEDHDLDVNFDYLIWALNEEDK